MSVYVRSMRVGARCYYTTTTSGSAGGKCTKRRMPMFCRSRCGLARVGCRSGHRLRQEWDQEWNGGETRFTVKSTTMGKVNETHRQNLSPSQGEPSWSVVLGSAVEVLAGRNSVIALSTVRPVCVCLCALSGVLAAESGRLMVC